MLKIGVPSKGRLMEKTFDWFGARGVTVNTVQPGPIDTDMNPDNTDMANMLKSGLPLKRYGKVEEIAAAVAFLASPEAGYITGTTLNVDGGANA